MPDAASTPTHSVTATATPPATDRGGASVEAPFTQPLDDVDRPRPVDDLANGLLGPLFPVDHGSFPSGHAVSANAHWFSDAVFAFAVTLATPLGGEPLSATVAYTR